MFITKAPKPKVYHRAKYIREDGHVSALCFARPRLIDLRRASWTLTDKGVTCPKCLEAIAARDAAKAAQPAPSPS